MESGRRKQPADDERPTTFDDVSRDNEGQDAPVQSPYINPGKQQKRIHNPEDTSRGRDPRYRNPGIASR